MKKILVVVTGLLVTSVVSAEHASISLRVLRVDPATGQSKEEVEAGADQEPPVGGVAPRPMFKATPGEPLTLQFFFTNTYPHGVTKDVTIRYFVVKTTKVKQKETPDPRDGAVVQGSFTLNFKPKSRVGARVPFTIREPGVYLLRVDSLNTQSDHEHFSAIDVVVE